MEQRWISFVYEVDPVAIARRIMETGR